jgi:branched-chain amino acid transport system substrate-binding protein
MLGKSSNVFKLFLMFVLIFSLIATACSNKTAAPEPAPAPAPSDKSSSGAEVKKEEPKKQYAQGVTDTTIKIGTWGPQTGPAASYGLVGGGIDSYFKYINEQGGVNGRKFEFVFYDDGYQPAKAVAAAKKLVEEDKVFAIVGTIGTPSNAANKDYLTQKGIPLVSFASGASLFTDPVIKNYFGILPNYRSEGRLLAKYAVETLGKKKIGVLYQNDDFGKDNLAGVQDYATANGLELVTVPYTPTDIDYSPAALKMKEAGVDVVILATIPKPAAAFAKELRKLDSDAQLIANTVTGSDITVMSQLAGDAWKGVITGAFGHKPTEETPAMKTFREYWKKAYPNENEFSAFALSGWMYAEVLVEGVRRSGDNLTWENFIAQLETLNDWSGNYAEHVTHTPTSHKGTSAMYFMQEKDGQLVQISDPIKLD